jgi:hypothetical protein
MRIQNILLFITIFGIGICNGDTIDIEGADGHYQGVLANEKEIVEFILGIKHLNIGKDTPEEVINKTGRPETKNKQFGVGEVWNYRFVNNDNERQPYQVNCTIIFNMQGVLQAVNVDKLKASVTKTIYTKGDPASQKQTTVNSTDPNTSSSFPENPKAGQIFFNTTDLHFYGYNGKEWLQLDNPKTNP